jgi:hypothetical protein
MPVLFQCSCGRKLSVAEEHRGKRIRCPHCGGPTEVPGQTRPAAARAPAEMVRFACPCGKEMQARAEHGGQIVECPVCGADVTIPSDPQRARFRAEQPQSSRAAPAPPLPKKERAPRPNRDVAELVRKRPLWPWAVAAGLLLVLLAGGATGGWLWWSRKAKAEAEAREAAARAKANEPPKVPDLPERATEQAPDVGDLALVPADAQGFVMLRLAEAWALESTQKSLAQVKDQLKALGKGDLDFPKLMKEWTGLTPADVERATVVFADVEKDGLWFLVATTRPYDRTKALAKLEGVAEARFEGKTYHTGKLAGEPDLAVYFAAPRVLAFGPEAGVKQCIRQHARPKKAGPLREAIEVAGKRRLLVAGFAPKAEDVKRWKQNLQGGKAFWSLLDVEVATLSIVQADKDKTRIHLEARFLSPAKAKEGKVALEGLKAAMSLVALPMMEEQWRNGGTPEKDIEAAREAMQRMLDEFVVEVDGPNLKAALEAENKPFEGLKVRPVFPGPDDRRIIPPAPPNGRAE